ncbi:hypothetical protein C0966_17225 (plasmid) [Bacillus methanolicus]|uniref:hypothetical protein n=1 Tax=Bacillus methanolicus TaxID=1471 RepID=UPI0023803A26|nr:hypothetical protein [Bacillus methanolicus]MDE3841008.1 hypothetical protein [Bacillus methanolicus]
MNLRFKAMLSFLAVCVFLSGCSGDKFTEEVKKTEAKNQEIKKTQKEKEAVDNKELKEFYEDLEKPLDEVIQENDFDTVKIMDSIKATQQDHFQDGKEFAKYAAQILYQFYTLQISPDQYYEFLVKYGSESVKKDLPSKEDALNILTNLQNMYKKQNMNGENYVLTEVTYNRFKREGWFYRKVLTTNGEEYYITTIVKEDEGWKYEDDSPSPPFEEIEQTEQSFSN